MKRELGIARCGLACCLCARNDECRGCASEECPDKEWCYNRKCTLEKGISGCYECEDTTCRKGMLGKMKPLAFTQYVRENGLDALLDKLEADEKGGMVYHRDGITGDYDNFESADALVSFLKEE